ncbi:excalibur calcium-binding domain-containing protein [Propionibacteriaceae bacterium Y2011]
MTTQPKPAPKTTAPKTTAPKTTAAKPPPARTTAPKPQPDVQPKTESKTDPRFGTCKEAIRQGYGPYIQGKDPEYGWYRDRDKDGIVCER